ncbi:ABC transporter permease [Nocardiopsis sp. JB363]|uniref:ABC transporter permease n=1 Tax=Nocardiopsis sp. JB363 TaxID=1434837 RepID=UPI00097A4488|nr:ABC transporter permease [Nocardiopsis sp. JB363]SIO85808.1 putative transporter [Nocardiopsis sp. JB363]
MNADLNAVRAGLSRGWIEFLLSFRSGQELFGYLYMPILFVGMAITFDTVGLGDGEPIGAIVLSGGAAFFLVMLGITTVFQVLANEREDGTLLRAKAVPRGLLGYTVAKSVHVAAMSITAMTLIVVPGLLFVEGFGFQDWTDLVTLIWVCVLGMLALAPIGAILGSLITNPRMGVTLAMLPTIAIIMISGLLLSFEFLPGWVQTIGQVLPVYWLGLGVRSAMLPEAHAALELAGSWQLPQVAGVLAVWALVGLVVAQWVLRRMARRESGSRVQAAREKAMKRA